jgi:hypothetical protein
MKNDPDAVERVRESVAVGDVTRSYFDRRRESIPAVGSLGAFAGA